MGAKVTSPVRTAMKASSQDFVNIVWPIIADRLGGGSIIPIEVVTESDFAKELDMLGGIDAWHVMGDRNGIRGIASRVQWGVDYRTFTVRWKLASGNKTEWDKRMYAIAHPELGLITPAVTVQAYIDKRGGSLLSAGIVRTTDLFKAAAEIDDKWKTRSAPDGNRFRYINWSTLISCGYRVGLVE